MPSGRMRRGRGMRPFEVSERTRSPLGLMVNHSSGRYSFISSEEVSYEQGNTLSLGNDSIGHKKPGSIDLLPSLHFALSVMSRGSTLSIEPEAPVVNQTGMYS